MPPGPMRCEQHPGWILASVPARHLNIRFLNQTRAWPVKILSIGSRRSAWPASEVGTPAKSRSASTRLHSPEDIPGRKQTLELDVLHGYVVASSQKLHPGQRVTPKRRRNSSPSYDKKKSPQDTSRTECAAETQPRAFAGKAFLLRLCGIDHHRDCHILQFPRP